MNTASGHSGSESCTYCSPGQIGVINGSSALCVNCAAGYYSSTSGFKQTVGFDALAPNTTCDNCPAGQGSQLGASTCTACVAGKYSIGNGPCLACPSGKFSRDEFSQCVDGTSCPANSYCSGVSGAILSCPSGTVSNIGSVSHKACTPVIHTILVTTPSISVSWSKLSNVSYSIYQVETKVTSSNWTVVNVTSTNFTLNPLNHSTPVQVHHHPCTQ